MSASRPEHIAPPQLFYGDSEAAKYTENSRVVQIQYEMTQRAIELLALPDDEQCLLLDIGCGSGLSGVSVIRFSLPSETRSRCSKRQECLDEAGHHWVGLDISPSMLAVAREREVEGDLFLQDLGQGLGFRAGSFDGAISVSVIQWLCNADESSHVPQRRLLRFFSTLYTALARGSKAVFQFYPEGPKQIEMILAASMRAGFTGGLVVDYPNSTKAKKYFLVLFAGSVAGGPKQELPKALEDENAAGVVDYAKKRNSRTKKGKQGKGKDWVLHKKQLNRMRGKANVPVDTKYTARKRKAREDK
ncbi:Williams Beuren syndrome chromosome region 22 protein [Entophlyctis luteolus]|nr:Williams Beuren syndrome chromosome region 22 protein [Entophlyctis luteolus]